MANRKRIQEQTSNLQNTTQTTKDLVTRTPLKTGGDSCSTRGTRHVRLDTSTMKGKKV